LLTTAAPGEGLTAGDVGTVVHGNGDGCANEVEFITRDENTAAVVTLEALQVRSVAPREITHASQMAG